MSYRIAAIVAAAVAAAAFTTPASALTMKECSAKYQAAKEAGTLKGMKWNDFRKTECNSAAADASAGSEPTTANTENMKEPAAPTTKAPKGVVFPKSVDKKFANEFPGKARMHTCLDQYKINKKNGTLGGLKWIQKGGGYYSICNSRLKG